MFINGSNILCVNYDHKRGKGVFLLWERPRCKKYGCMIILFVKLNMAKKPRPF